MESYRKAGLRAPPSRGSTQRLLLCFWKLALLRTGGSSRNPSLYSFRRSASFFLAMHLLQSPVYPARFRQVGFRVPSIFTALVFFDLWIWFRLKNLGLCPCRAGFNCGFCFFCFKHLLGAWLLGFRFKVYGVKGPKRRFGVRVTCFPTCTITNDPT